MMHVDCSKPLGAVVSVTWRKITSTRVTETPKGELIFVIVPSVNSRAWHSLLTSHWSHVSVYWTWLRMRASELFDKWHPQGAGVSEHGLPQALYKEMPIDAAQRVSLCPALAPTLPQPLAGS